MLAGDKKSVEDLIVEILARKPQLTGPGIVAEVQHFRKTTKQAVYAAMSSLLETEVVTKAGSNYGLSRIWLRKISKLLHTHQVFESKREAIFQLRDGEGMTFRFPSLVACDRYWAHIFDVLTDWIPSHRPILVWNPHEWMIIGRSSVENEILRIFERRNKYAYYSIGGSTQLDLEFKSSWNSAHMEIGVGIDLNLPSTYYLNVIDSFILEVQIERRLADRIESFYQKNRRLSPGEVKQFEALISESSPVTMRIRRHEKRAQTLRKKLTRDFLLARGVKA